ncbi:MAG: hypothetical protein JST92_27625 [Deltaproteobacteria bacterium]|nr:hypothetical protein [Deltaproteobacteria bacterium]
MAAESATPVAGVPSDADIAKARADEARRENAEKARKALAEKRAQDAAKEGSGQKPAAEPTATKGKPSEEALKAGARLMVRLLWVLASLGSRMFGGTLEPLSLEQLEEGVTEGLPLVRRFSVLATILAFLGFPLWLFERIGAAFKRKPEQPQTAQAQTAPSNVTPLRTSGGQS